MPTLSEAPHVERIANGLIAEHHRALAQFRLRYLGSDGKPPKKLTCKAYADPALLSPRERFLSSGGSDQEEGDHVALTVNELLWSQLTDAQRRAVIDHALCHLFVDEDGVLGKIEHEIGDFAAVIRRHGIWIDSMRPAAEAIRQLPLLGSNGHKADAEAVIEGVNETVRRLVKGDRDGIPDDVTRAYDRLVSGGATVTAGGGE